MKKDELNKRSLKLQEGYIKKNGLVGLKESKSKTLRKDRYKCHKKLTAYFLIYPRRKLMHKTNDYPCDVQKYVDVLINDFGYSLQTTIN